MAAMARLFALILAAMATALPAAAQDAAGTVSRVQGSALAVKDAVPRILAPGSDVFINDVLSTGPGSRLEIVLRDESVFVLGETAAFVIVDFTFGQVGANERVFRVLQGAFVAVSGAIGQVAENDQFRVDTPTATIGIRGTTVWGGTLDDLYQVVVLDGTGVVVSTPAGSVELAAGQGTQVVPNGGAPGPATAWPAAKIARALATVAFSP